MKPALKLPINLSRLDKSEIYEFKGDKYATIVLWPLDEPNDSLYSARQEIHPERRNKGEKAPCLGFVKYLSKQKQQEKELSPDMPF